MPRGDIIRPETEFKNVPLPEIQNPDLVSKVLLEVDKLNKAARLELEKAREVFDKTGAREVLKKLCPSYIGFNEFGVIKYKYLAGDKEKQQSVEFSGINFEEGGWIYDPGGDQPSLEELGRILSRLASINSLDPKKFSVSSYEASVAMINTGFKNLDEGYLRGKIYSLTTIKNIHFRLLDPLEEPRLELRVSLGQIIDHGITGKEIPPEPVSMLIPRSSWKQELLSLITSQILKSFDQAVTLPIQ